MERTYPYAGLDVYQSEIVVSWVRQAEAGFVDWKTPADSRGLKGPIQPLPYPSFCPAIPFALHYSFEEATIFSFLRRIFGSARRDGGQLLPESLFEVTLDDQAVVGKRPDGKKESVSWDNLTSVAFETNNSGPWGPDVIWLPIGTETISGCPVPQGGTGDQAHLVRLQQLPDFNNEAIISAMGLVESQRFLCWEAAP
ncbi:MAG: hypothetical protein K0U98_24165 [Deltaproteobacteria bacterium]|nr:hypothetical protein [Deltaproteobacteria bacterium]